jgi:hypothetical protein
LSNAFANVIYENGVRANFNLCMFAPMSYEELILCGDEGRLKTYERRDFLPGSGSSTHLEILCGEDKPSRIAKPASPVYIEESGHNGATYFEHVHFVNNIGSLSFCVVCPMKVDYSKTRNKQRGQTNRENNKCYRSRY